MAAEPYSGDPRVLFAAERTLLAWQRSAIALMGFGFVIERSGLLLHSVAGHSESNLHRAVSLALGVFFIAIGGAMNIASMRQFKLLLRVLDPSARPPGYWVLTAFWVGTALVIAAAVLVLYLLLGV